MSPSNSDVDFIFPSIENLDIQPFLLIIMWELSAEKLFTTLHSSSFIFISVSNTFGYSFMRAYIKIIAVP